jgi:hypothetical protein
VLTPHPENNNNFKSSKRASSMQSYGRRYPWRP